MSKQLNTETKNGDTEYGSSYAIMQGRTRV